MPYCTIEEAFGSPFEQSNTKDFSEVVPDNAYIDEGDEFSQFRKNEDQKFKRKKQNQHTWSRTLDRLPEHSGPENRYPDQKNRKELIIEPSANNTEFPTKKLNDQYEYPTNKRAPIDPYDKEVYEELEDDFHNIAEEEDDTRLDITKNISDITSKTNKGIEKQISKLISDNERLKKYIYDELHKPLIKGDSISDIVLYVLIGIFIIYLLDIFVQLMKTLILRN
jgi:hypothetical protein